VALIYFLKFCASFLLPPGIFFVFLMLLTVYLWKRCRGAAQLLAGVTVCFYLLSTSYVGDSLLSGLEQRYQPPEEVRGDVIVMLGGGATLDTPDLDGLGNLSGSAANRLLTALRLERRLDVPVILSGGKVFADSGREADIAERIARQFGIPAEKIHVENQSLNTRQNAQYVKRIMEEHGFTRPILVTSAFHMERSVLNFSRAGVSAVPYPADYSVSRTSGLYFNKFAPSADGLRNSCIFFREWLGIWALRIMG
jgi:uncharacterized SAM-binding protein YcdF (DUF218 family)